VLWAATQVLPAAPRMSQGPVATVVPPLDEPELLELPEEPELLLEAPEEPELLELPDELELVVLPEEPELLEPLEELELVVLPEEPELLEPLPELLSVPAPLLLSPVPLLLPEELPVPLEPSPALPTSESPDEKDQHATRTAPSDTATDAGTMARIFFIAGSPVASVARCEAGGWVCDALFRPVRDHVERQLALPG
jgi:hypothetical protein